MIPERVLEYINSCQERYINELKDFLKIPSISSPEHVEDIKKAAEWALDRAKRQGFSGALYETSRNPIVFAKLCPYDDAPTLLFYSHFDVQPAGELDKWETSPFYPEVRNGAIYGRGTADDKGQLFCSLAAMESVMAVEGKLPLNVKLLFEGGEEAGSPGVGQFIDTHTDMLKADAALMTDAPKYARDLLAIYYGLRGGLAYRVEVTGPARDVHSGMFGGAVANPINALARILGNIKDNTGKIRIPGFYDKVHGIEEWERKEMATLSLGTADMKNYLGVNELVHEEGYTPIESIMARPTFDVNGIAGGYYDKGMLWSIPDKVGAIISFLLVPDQDPDEIANLFEEYVYSATPEGVKVKLSRAVSFDPVLIRRNSEAVKIAEKAIEYGFGRKPAMIRSGGGIEVAALLKKRLHMEDIVITGWSDPEDNEHAPNERLKLENFRKGMITTVAFMYGLARAMDPKAILKITQSTI